MPSPRQAVRREVQEEFEDEAEEDAAQAGPSAPASKSPIRMIALGVAAAVVVAAGGGTAIYYATRPAPPVSVPPLPVFAHNGLIETPKVPEATPAPAPQPATPSPANTPGPSANDFADPPPSIDRESPPAVETPRETPKPPVATKPPVSSPRPKLPKRPKEPASDSPAIAQALGDATLEVVSSATWAVIFVDDRRIGFTPVKLTLPPGKHRIRAEHEGMAPVDYSVNLAAGENSRWSPRFTPHAP